MGEFNVFLHQLLDVLRRVSDTFDIYKIHLMSDGKTILDSSWIKTFGAKDDTLINRLY